MSPHAVIQSDNTILKDYVLPGEYDVGCNGFLPNELPLAVLPDPYYAPWESLIHRLSDSLQAQTLRQEVDTLPVLKASRLNTLPEWRRAYVILSFLAHGYIWGGDRPSEILPPPITLPLLQVAAHLELPPVATYAALNLWNYTSSTPNNLTCPDTLHALHTFTGTEDESWFYIVSAAMEAQGATIIPVLLHAVESGDPAVLASALGQLCRCVKRLKALLGRMPERCDPTVFYTRIRPFLAGSRNMGPAGLPRGVLYDRGGGEGSWTRLRGGSNGQSSLIQFLDIVLGVDHVPSGHASPEGRCEGEGEKELSFHEEVRGYMPGPHRRFLEDVAMGASVRDLASRPGGGLEQERLREAFRVATEVLADFRNKHLEIVTRYIIIPARQQRAGGSVNLANTLVSKDRVADGKPQELTGTGGTALLPFLKQVRDETLQAGDLPVATHKTGCAS